MHKIPNDNTEHSGSAAMILSVLPILLLTILYLAPLSPHHQQNTSQGAV